MDKSASTKDHHAGSQSDFDDIDEKINANPCVNFYMQLEECLVDSDRNWKVCQPEVKALKECSIRVAKKNTKD